MLDAAAATLSFIAAFSLFFITLSLFAAIIRFIFAIFLPCCLLPHTIFRDIRHYASRRADYAISLMLLLIAIALCACCCHLADAPDIFHAIALLDALR